MATISISKQQNFPYSRILPEKLTQIANEISMDTIDNIAFFRKNTFPISINQVPWESLQYLYIDTSFHFESAGISPGAYLNADGTWLLLTMMSDREIQDILNTQCLQLRQLTLRRTHLTEVNLSSLSSLELLELSFHSSLQVILGMENLTQLTMLYISWCEDLIDLPHLDKLSSLEVLSISNCESLIQLPGLERLSCLEELYLSWCLHLSSIQETKNLTQLTSLSVDCCWDLNIISLENHLHLSKLNVSSCSNLTTLILSGCKHLSSLNLSDCPNLKTVNLSRCTKLTSLPWLKHLKKLSILKLNGCQSLATLNGLDQLFLRKLHLAGCISLTELPNSIGRMSTLRKLDLRGLHLKEFPEWLPNIAERFWMAGYGRYVGKEKAVVYLHGTTIEGVDMSIFDQPFDVIKEFFRLHSLGQTQMLNEIKVVFLGDGEAGKSHTIARLMNDGGEPVDYTDQATPGIVIKHKYYAADGRTFRVNYWDFGGQEIMHSMHRIFLTGRTMYIVLLNARDDTQSDRAKYWLHNIQSFAPDAPVLLVLNKIDQNPNASVDERDLRGRCEKLTKIVRLSALKDNQEDFNKKFTDVLKEEILNTGFLDAEWPSSWKQVKERLEDMSSHYISGDEYEDICQECHVDKNQKNLLHWFNDLGVSFCCCDKEDYDLNDYVILRPDWITNALYILLFNPLEGAENGLIPRSVIYDMLRSARSNPDIHCTLPNARYTSGDIIYVLGVMRKFNLSQPHGTDHEFIPMLCQQNSTVDVQSYHKDTNILEFNMEFDYLPNNLLHRLMVERHRELDMENVWRTGAKFHLPELGLSAVVVIDSNILHFFIRHDNEANRPNTYLAMLKANVDRIVEKMGLKAPACKLIYKLDGKRDEFDFEELKMLQEIGQPAALSKAWRRMIPIPDILNQSAPDGLKDEQKLLDAIRKSCLNIQAEPEYYLKGSESGRGMEDKRNRRIRDDLEMVGYTVKDQTQRGLSGTGRSVGELDLLLYNDTKDPWTIIEALRISSGAKTDWNEHLDKLVENYNYFGAPCVYLLTYVDATADAFQKIWEGYQHHIPKHAPGRFTYCADSLVIQEDPTGPQDIKTAKCRYACGVKTTTAYHIFARIPTQNG